MNERILNLLSLCMQAKGKGIDCFFNYSPHVETVRIDIHSPHWVPAQKDENGGYISGSDNLARTIEFYTNAEDFRESKLAEAETYLKGLVEA